MKDLRTRLHWSDGKDRIVVYGDPRGHFAWQRRTKLGEALEDPHGPFDSLDEAARDAREKPWPPRRKG